MGFPGVAISKKGRECRMMEVSAIEQKANAPRKV
jgi:hypothetical protein